MKKIILASESPRRRYLLNLMGVKFEVQRSKWDEEGAGLNLFPQELCNYNATQKAKSIKLLPDEDCIVIGCDTIVVLDKKILGKPANLEEARKMLSILSNRTHKVYSGLSVIDNKKKTTITEAVATKVTFKPLSQIEIDGYVSTDEPFDKAGAYGIQGKGALFVEKIEGCYYNVVGLPVSRLYEILNNLGIDIWS